MAPRTKQQQQKNNKVIDPRLAKALDHPLRIEILAEANKGIPLSPKEFTALKPKERELSGVNYHFRRLEELDCLEVVRETQRRGGTEHHYVPISRTFYDSIDWDELPVSVGDSMNFTILKTLNEQVVEAIEAGTFDSQDNVHFTWTPVKLDQEGWDTLMAKIDVIYESLRDEEVAAAERMLESGEEPMHTTIAFAGFESPSPKRKRLASQIAEKRADQDFGDRVERRMTEDAEVLEQLQGSDEQAAPTVPLSQCPPPRGGAFRAEFADYLGV